MEILQDGDTYYVNISIDEIGFFTDSTPVIEYVPVYVPVAEEKIELSSKLKKRILRHAKGHHESCKLGELLAKVEEGG